MIKRLLAALVIIASLGMTGCAKVAQDRQKLLAAIDRTEQVARTFIYAEKAGGHQTVVNVAIRDDLRFREDATVDGKPLLSSVTYDDTRAIYVASQGGTNILVPQKTQSTSSTGVTTTPTKAVALPTGVWVADPQGAASLTLTTPPAQPGKDPLADALTSLEYVRQAMSQAKDVQKFNPESENYRPRLDPFPRPASGEIRYDLVPPDLPPRQRIGTASNIGLQNQVPGVPFFRLLAVYVKDGLVQEVREKVSIEPRLRDSQSNLETRINDFTSVSPNASISLQAAALLLSINQKLQLQSQPLIRPRDLDIKFSGLGRKPQIQLPANPQKVDLSGLGPYGLLLYESH